MLFGIFYFYWKNFQFGLSKIDKLEREHRQYLESVKNLAGEVGITFTPHTRKDLEKPSF